MRLLAPLSSTHKKDKVSFDILELCTTCSLLAEHLSLSSSEVPSVPPPPPPPTSLSPPVTILSTPDGRRLSIKVLQVMLRCLLFGMFDVSDVVAVV